MANHAQTEIRTAYLNTPFGVGLAQLWFGFDEAILTGLVGRYTRGKRKGQLRGAIQYRKVVKGGWKSDGPSYGDGPNGHVVVPGQILDKAIIDAWTLKTIYAEN